jgi:hypothetical protein
MLVAVVADRVKESTNVEGTGTASLLGAPPTFQTFAHGVGVGNKTFYVIVDPENNAWESGYGTLLTTTTLSRDAVYESSNNNTWVPFAFGRKTIFLPLPAKRAVYYPLDSYDLQLSGSGIFSGSFQVLGSASVGTLAASFITGTFKGDGSALTGVTATATSSISVSSSYATTASFTSTASFASRVLASGIAPGTMSGDFLINGNVSIPGTASVGLLYSIYTTASVIFQSGSTIWGDTLDDLHRVTGSLLVTGSSVFTGPLTASGFSGVGTGITGVVSASYASSASAAVHAIQSNAATSASNAALATTSQLQFAFDIRQLAPSSSLTQRMTYGFTTWNNTGTAPYADYLLMRGWTDASGQNDNLVMFNRSALGMRIWQQVWGSTGSFATFKDVAWTDGTNATGTWTVSTSGNAATATTASYALTSSLPPTVPLKNSSNTFTNFPDYGVASSNAQNSKWNPYYTAIAAGKPLFTDEEFALGVNGITIYNFGTAVVSHSWDTDPTAPNATGRTVSIYYDGSGNASPGNGGFAQTFTPRLNATYIQRFRAKIPVGYTVVPGSNSVGLDGNYAFIGLTTGSGKWEEYTRVIYTGSTGSLSTTGHVSLNGPSSPAMSWSLASCTTYEVNRSGVLGITDSQMASISGSKVAGNIPGNAANITSFTINQNVGTSNTPTFAGATLSGPVLVTGSFNQTGSANIVGSLTASTFAGNGAAIVGVVTSSYALSASAAVHAIQSDLSVTASFASTIYGSNVNGTVATATTASYALSASAAVHAVQADVATSASFASVASTGMSGFIAPSIIVTGLTTLNGGLLVTGSFNQTGSYNVVGPFTASTLAGNGAAIVGVVTSSYALSSSAAVHAIQSDLSVSASFASTIYGSNVNGTVATATTSSYSLSGSAAVHAIQADLATTSSYATVAQSVLGNVTTSVSASFAQVAATGMSGFTAPTIAIAGLTTLNGGVLVTGSFNQTGSHNIVGPLTASTFAGNGGAIVGVVTSSYALSSSAAGHAVQADTTTTASFASVAATGMSGFTAPTITVSGLVTAGTFSGNGALITGVVTSSYALSGSAAVHAVQADNAVTASFASTVYGANVNGAVATATTASYSLSGSATVHAIQSDLAVTASFASVAATGMSGFAAPTITIAGLATLNGGVLVTGSFNQTGSCNVVGPFTASLFAGNGSAITNLTATNIVGTVATAISASFAQVAATGMSGFTAPNLASSGILSVTGLTTLQNLSVVSASFSGPISASGAYTASGMRIMNGTGTDQYYLEMGGGNTILGRIYRPSSTNDIRFDAPFGAFVFSSGITAPTYRYNSTTIQSGAPFGARFGGNSFEFGHPNQAGYGSTLGAESSTGSPFLAFYAEAGTNANTYRTRGIAGLVFLGQSSGFGFYSVTNANADNQGLTALATLSTSGVLNTVGAITQNGNQVLHASNYNTYTPTLTGTGASGTWGISITGNSATTSQTTFGRVVTNGITRGSYGSISITSSTGGYAGIDFGAASRTFMVSTDGALQGIYNESGGVWQWYWNNGVLAAGTVPVANVSGLANSATITAATGATASTIAQRDSSGQLTAVAYFTSSQRALKTNITSFTKSALDILNTVDVVAYEYREDPNRSAKVGFIADDTDEILSGKDREVMDMANSIGLLIKAVQELSIELDKLKK